MDERYFPRHEALLRQEEAIRRRQEQPAEEQCACFQQQGCVWRRGCCCLSDTKVPCGICNNGGWENRDHFCTESILLVAQPLRLREERETRNRAHGRRGKKAVFGEGLKLRDIGWLRHPACGCFWALISPWLVGGTLSHPSTPTTALALPRHGTRRAAGAQVTKCVTVKTQLKEKRQRLRKQLSCLKAVWDSWGKTNEKEFLQLSAGERGEVCTALSRSAVPMTFCRCELTFV